VKVRVPHIPSPAALRTAGAAGVFATVMAGTTTPTPLYGLYRQEVGFSELTVTVVFAVYAAGVIGCLLLLGEASDTVGRRPIVLLGVGCAVVSGLCFLSEGGLPLLFAGRLLSGFSAGLFTGAATAYVLELAPPGGGSRAALIATAANMGGLGLGPVVSGLLSQYAPWPLRLPFAVHLGLLAVAAAVAWALPETVPHPRPWASLRPRLPLVSAEVRTVFAPAAVAAFVGFSLLGVFTSVTPAFLASDLGVHNRFLIGLIVFSAFAGSLCGQLLESAVGGWRSLAAGCRLLVAGMILMAVSLAWVSLTALVACALIGGAGQGLALRAAVGLITTAAPADARARNSSALFLIAYLGISVPVVGVGLLAAKAGLRSAGLVFAALMAVLAGAAWAYLARQEPPRHEHRVR
jgi:predicted MFS family arabinose efflux permease